jgi:hypothetical protein
MEKTSSIEEKLCDDIKEPSCKDGLLPEVRVIFDEIIRKQKNGEPLTVLEKRMAIFTIELANLQEKLDSKS